MINSAIQSSSTESYGMLQLWSLPFPSPHLSPQVTNLGQLRLGRNSFRQLSVLGPELREFPEYMKFVTFDDANPRMRDKPYEERFSNCANAVQDHPLLVSLYLLHFIFILLFFLLFFDCL